jgi:hypothetical protein
LGIVVYLLGGLAILIVAPGFPVPACLPKELSNRAMSALLLADSVRDLVLARAGSQELEKKITEFTLP